MNKRLLSAVCTILVCTLVLVVPFPTRVNSALSGVRVERGVGMNDITMTLKGWRLRSLLCGDRLSTTLNVAPFGAKSEESLTVPVKGSILGHSGYRIVFDRYISSQNRYVTATLYFAGDFSQMLYCDEADGESTYVVYKGDSADVQAIVDGLHGRETVNQ